MNSRIIIGAIFIFVLMFFLFRLGGSQKKGEKMPDVQPIQLNKDSGYLGSVDDMKQFLKCWSKQARTASRAPGDGIYEAYVSKIGQEEQLRRIQVMEKRLGSSLPDSFKNFLMAGGDHFQTFENIEYSTTKHFSLHDAVADYYSVNKKDAIIWEEDVGETNISDHFNYSNKQDSAQYYRPYIKHLIVVGGYDGRAPSYFLNPYIRLKDGEWEAWYLSGDLPGAYRFPSFAHLLRYIYRDDMMSKYKSYMPLYPFGAPPVNVDVSCEKYLKAEDIETEIAAVAGS